MSEGSHPFSLRGPAVSKHEELVVRAYSHVMKDEWFEAIEAFDDILALPNLAPLDRGAFRSSQATCLMNVGRSHEAAEGYEWALTVRQEKHALRENIIFSRDHCEDTTIQRAFELRREFWAKHGAQLYADHQQPHENDRDPERPLRIGYVGGDFRTHSANLAFAPVVLRHSAGYEPIFYSSSSPALWDMFTSIYSQEKTFRVVWDTPDDVVCRLIRRDKIDILVDLASFTNHGRLSVFCMKPAPVQVTAWGYILGTGLDTVDALLGDPIATPYRDQEFYSEKLMHLPSIIPFIGQTYAPEPSLLPTLALKQPFTFGCFCRPAKIGDMTLALWSKILKAAPQTRLLLKDAWIGSPFHKARVLKALDVDPSRVLFEGTSVHKDHLGAWGKVDLQLDPYPIAGGVSTLEGMWQGVPALIRRPPSPARVVSSVSLSAATLLGLEDFIADDDEAYVRLAIAWSTEGRQPLSQWRAKLRGLMFNSPLIQKYVERVEDAYRELWRDWCKR